MRTLPVFPLLLLVVGFAPAADRTHEIVPEDYFSIAMVTDLAVSPGGKHVAYCDSRWDKGANNRRSDLWVVGIEGKEKPRRLTVDRANDRHPQWAADGKSIYVLGNRKREAEKKPPYDGTSQVWKIPVAGGEPAPITRVDGGVTGFDYAPKSEAIFFSVDSTDHTDDEFTKLRKKFDQVEYGHGPHKISEIRKLDLTSWREETVVAEKRYVRSFAVNNDGSRVGMITAPDDTVVQSEGNSRVDVWDAETGKVTETDNSWKSTAASPYPWLGEIAWNPAGDRLAFCTIFDAYPTEIIIQEFARGAWKGIRMKRPDGVHVRGYGSPLRWLSDTALGYLAEKSGFVDVLGFGLESRDTLGIMRENVVVSAFDTTPIGGAVCLEGSPTSFADLHTRGQNPIRLTNLNPQTDTWKLPAVSHVTWTAPDGSKVGGVLELPYGYKPETGGKLPLVVAIHGGPTTATKAEMIFDPHNGRMYFSAKGYAVLCPNYRGSVGYGDKFVTDLIGHENDVEVKDILAGVQHLVKAGIADPDRVACMGWSNGGYLTNCLITLKDPPVKFKAASSGAGILDTVAEWGFNDEPAYPIVFKKGLPWETPEIYRKTSPTYGIANVTTPTLIHVGGGDERCPPGHSRMLYRALREYKKVPTELIVYTGEPHGLTKYANRKAKMEWDLAWFGKYLK